MSQTLGEDDDVFDESDEAMRRMEDRSYKRYLEKFKKEGLREGLTSEENEVPLQEGFNVGYEAGFKSARLRSFIKSSVSLILGLYQEKRLNPISEGNLEKMEGYHNEILRIHESGSEEELQEFLKVYSAFLSTVECPIPPPDLEFFSTNINTLALS